MFCKAVSPPLRLADEHAGNGLCIIIQLRFITLSPEPAYLSSVAHSYFRLYDQEDPFLEAAFAVTDESPGENTLSSASPIVRRSNIGSRSNRGQMTRCRCLCVLLLLLGVISIGTEAAKGGGRGARGRGRGRVYGSRMPILIPHRNPASAHYYENKDGAKIVKASHFELDYMLGRKITFFCMAAGFPRPEITWLKDGIELYHHKFFQVHEWRIGNDTIKSKMEIDPATQKDAGYYECQADNQYAVDRRGFRTDYVMISY